MKSFVQERSRAYIKNDLGNLNQTIALKKNQEKNQTNRNKSKTNKEKKKINQNKNNCIRT